MKNQALFSSKDKSKKLKCHLLQFLFGILRVNTWNAKFSLSNSIALKMAKTLYFRVLAVLRAIGFKIGRRHGSAVIHLKSCH